MTFSIVAIEQKTKTIGVATTTANPSVGSRVPHAKNGVGAIATQGLTEIYYGIKGLKLLERAHTPQEVLEILLKNDREKEHRQLIIIDIHGKKAAFTGKECFDFKGHIIGKDYVVAGNFLANDNVVKEMAKAFEKGNEFVEKLVLTLEAGKKAGGDRRGERSAALVVVSSTNTGVNLDLRVDNNYQPIKELRQLFEKRKNYSVSSSITYNSG